MRIYNPIHFWRTFWAYWNEFDGQPICKRPRRRLHSSWVQTTCVLVPWIDWPKHKFKLPSIGHRNSYSEGNNDEPISLG